MPKENETETTETTEIVDVEASADPVAVIEQREGEDVEVLVDAPEPEIEPQELPRPLFNLDTEEGRKHLAEKIRWQGGIVNTFFNLHPLKALAMDAELGRGVRLLHEGVRVIKGRLLELGIEEG